MERYTRLRKVGSGSFGEVYQGVDNETGEAVAIKASRSPRSTTFTQAETPNFEIILKILGGGGLARLALCNLPRGKCLPQALTRCHPGV